MRISQPSLDIKMIVSMLTLVVTSFLNPFIYTFWNECPGFGQDRVNFHRTPGRGTAGWSDPTWLNRAGYSIPCAIMLGSGGGELGGGNSLWLGSARRRSWRAALWVVRFVLCFLFICIIVVPVPFVCCSVKLPLSRPTGFFLFSSHSPPHRSRGRGGHVALLLPAAAKPEQ